MKKHKLFRLLSALSNDELKKFSDFLHSPYFNKSQTLISLFDYIRNYYPDFSGRDFSKQGIFQHLKPDQKFSNKFVNNRLFDLTSVLSEFLTVQQFLKNPHQKAKHFLESLIEHEQFELCEKESFKEIDRILATQEFSWQYFLQLWSTNYLIFTHPNTLKFKEKKDDAQLMMSYLDEAYAILKLRYGFHKILRFGIFREKERIVLLYEIINAHKNTTNPVIKLYLVLFDYFNAENKATVWESANSYFLKKYDSFPNEEKLSFLTILVNLGFKLALDGDSEYFTKLHILYKKGLGEKIWVYYGYMSEQTFKNIVVVGSSTKEFVWTENFIQEYQSFLSKKHKNNVIIFAEAYLEFYKGNYEKSKLILNEARILGYANKLSFKSLDIRCLYELRCVDENLESVLDSEISAFNKFLQRSDKLSIERVEVYRNFNHIVKLLNRAKSEILPSSKTLNKIKKELQKRKRIIARTWLKEKINQLE